LLTAVMLRYFYVRDQWQEQVRVNAKASLQALQARINPHFLFNSMNTIAALVRRDPATAETAIEDLSDLFRAALGDEDTESTLAQELQIVRQYLAIEQLRLGPRLRVDWQLANNLPMDCPMPRLMLQPLFENAVVHGIAELPEGGDIRFEAQIDAGLMHFILSNPVPAQPVFAGHGHALASVKKRLELFYGAKAGIQERQHEGQYISHMQVPYG
jgi:two-component system sensor histidine kinase AlgZ